MSGSTKGIALHYYKYSESSIISKIFTKESGLKSYIIKGIRNKKSKTKLNLLMPLSLIEIESTNNIKSSLQYIKEIKSVFPLQGIYNDMSKKFICMFVSDVLLRVLVENKKDSTLYKFIENIILDLSVSKNIPKNYILIFLLKLSECLGFSPEKSNSEKKYFDLENACFTNSKTHYFIEGQNKSYLADILNNKDVEIPYKNRKDLILKIQEFFFIHQYNIQNLKSYNTIESLR